MGLETLALILALNGPMNKIENIPEKIIPNYSTELVKEKNDSYSRIEYISNKVKKIEEPNKSGLYLGISGPCHGMFIPPIPLVPRIQYKFNNTFGIQGDLGLFGFIGLDATARVSKKGPFDFYLFAGGLTVSPLIYLFNTQIPDGPTSAGDIGVGLTWNFFNGDFNLNLEGGIIVPLPFEKDTSAFRIDLSTMWKIH